MHSQEPSSLAVIIFTLCASFLSAHAEPAKAYQQFIHSQSQLKKNIIQSVDLEQVTLREALETLIVQISQVSDKKTTPNFIIRDPDGRFDNRRITLQINNVPANVLLQYIADQVGGDIHYDQYAIIIKPLRTAPR
ncbi:MAG: hypothetical protein ACPIA7_02930 [Akkermansiaceae bacterium]